MAHSSVFMDRLRMAQLFRLMRTQRAGKERGPRKWMLSASVKERVCVLAILERYELNKDDFIKSILQIQQRSVNFHFHDDVLMEVSVQRRSHFCSSNRRSFGRWSVICGVSGTSFFSATRCLTASKD